MTSRVQPGIDVLLTDHIDALADARCGLITNTSAITSSGVLDIDALYEAPGVDLVALYSPEHGLRQQQDDGQVASGTDETTGLPIHSLYGETRKPSPEQLEGIDLLIFDIQDVGLRFYTYISTLSLAMEAAAEAGIAFVVLDRPNPLAGLITEGPVLDPEFRSFVGCQPIPTRHAMTVGELARLFNARFMEAPCDLQIIPAQGWTRDLWFDQTGLPWAKPSPGIYTFDTELAYGATCFFEGTTLSEGRGTDHPFELSGAPFIDGDVLSAALNDLGLQGVQFEPATFTPISSKHKGTECGGVFLHVTDREAYRCITTSVAMLCEIRRLWPDDFAWREPSSINRLAGTDSLRNSISAGVAYDAIIAPWQADLDAFAATAREFLLY